MVHTVPAVGAMGTFSGRPEVGAGWRAGRVMPGGPLAAWEGLGPGWAESRPSSLRAELLRLRSQELTVGWLRAFCRSPTFCPSSVVTLSTLRLWEGGRRSPGPPLGLRTPRAGHRTPLRLPLWTVWPWTWGTGTGPPALPPLRQGGQAHLEHPGVEVGEGVDVHGDVGLGQVLQLLHGGTTWGGSGEKGQGGAREGATCRRGSPR